VNSGATIFDDRETVELLRDHPHLLAIADAVCATQTRRSAFEQHRRPLLVAAAALVACGTAAALTVALAIPSATTHHSPGGSHGPHRVQMPPPIPVSLDQAQSDMSNQFGASLVLPDTSALGPSETPTILEQPCLKAVDVPTAPLCWVTVRFPSPAVDIDYIRTSATWGSRYPDARDQYQQEIADPGNPSDFQIVSLNGTPALIRTTQTGNTIEFRLGELSITITAPNGDTPTTIGAADLETLAQSMLDQAGNG
jgi:hypothetical protein